MGEMGAQSFAAVAAGCGGPCVAQLTGTEVASVNMAVPAVCCVAAVTQLGWQNGLLEGNCLWP